METFWLVWLQANHQWLCIIWMKDTYCLQTLGNYSPSNSKNTETFLLAEAPINNWCLISIFALKCTISKVCSAESFWQISHHLPNKLHATYRPHPPTGLGVHIFPPDQFLHHIYKHMANNSWAICACEAFIRPEVFLQPQILTPSFTFPTQWRHSSFILSMGETTSAGNK